MGKNTLFYIIISALNAFLSMLCGLVVIYSITYDLQSYAMNGIVGSIFIFISVFTYFKMRSTANFMKDNKSLPIKKQFIAINIFQAAFFTLVFLLGLSAVVSRAFGERLPIFD